MTRLAALLALVFFLIAGSAMLRTSTTFDEIVFPAVGARGLHTGDFSMLIDHPRLPKYVYGLPVYLSGVNYPAEEGYRWGSNSSFYYARSLYWGMGNYPERITLVTRLVGLAFGTLTVLGVFFLGRRHLGAGPALFAAALVAFLPDMLAHSGVAYNDVPLAFGVLVSVYALDAAVRRPTPRRVALAALACALTACIKYSGLIVGPILVALLALEALSGRWRDREWRRAVALAVPMFALVFYFTIVLLYAGDWRLAEYIDGLREVVRYSKGGRGVPMLLGDRSATGWWYYFPVAFLLKTPLALHVLMVIALFGGWHAVRDGRWRGRLTHGARAPTVGAALLLAALMASRVNIGVRHALPMLPLVCILVAQGVAPFWQRGHIAVRAALAVLLAGFILSSVRHYPYFLSYISEYAEGRPLHETLVDSSTDWGQGLVALRAFMLERGIDEVALGYFGSALPEGYGIRYLAMPSFLELPPGGATHQAPRYLVVSTTLLVGYHLDDPYAALRAAKPVAILARSLYVFDREALGRP
jgi:hypothetical protein